MMSNIAQYVGWNTRNRNGKTFWSRKGPLILALLSVPLVMADLTRHELQDYGVWTSSPCVTLPDAQSFNKTACLAAGACGFDPTPVSGGCYNADFWTGSSSMFMGPNDSLTFIGILFSIIFTWCAHVRSVYLLL